MALVQMRDPEATATGNAANDSPSGWVVAHWLCDHHDMHNSGYRSYPVSQLTAKLQTVVLLHEFFYEQGKQSQESMSTLQASFNS